MFALPFCFMLSDTKEYPRNVWFLLLKCITNMAPCSSSHLTLWWKSLKPPWFLIPFSLKGSTHLRSADGFSFWFREISPLICLHLSSFCICWVLYVRDICDLNIGFLPTPYVPTPCLKCFNLVVKTFFCVSKSIFGSVYFFLWCF